MTDAEVKFKPKTIKIKMWEVVFMGLLMVGTSISLKEEFVVPWTVVGIVLFFGLLFLALFVCIIQILAKLGTDAPMIALQNAVYSLFCGLSVAACFTPGLIRKLLVGQVSVVFLIYAVVAWGSWNVIQCTRRVLKSDREQLPTTTQPIEPSVESSHQIAP